MTREISCKVEPYSNIDYEASLAATGEPTVVKKDPGGGVVICVSHQNPYRRPGDPATQAGLLIFWLLAPLPALYCDSLLQLYSRSAPARPWPAPEHQAAPASTCSAGVVGTDVLGAHACVCDEFPRGSECLVGGDKQHSPQYHSTGRRAGSPGGWESCLIHEPWIRREGRTCLECEVPSKLVIVRHDEK